MSIYNPATSESILIYVRPMCNVDKDDDGFDEKLIPLINAQMMIANHEIGDMERLARGGRAQAGRHQNMARAERPAAV